MISRHLLLLVMLLAASAAAFNKSLRQPEPSSFSAPSLQRDHRPATFHSGFVSPRHNIAVHAASLVELGDGRLRAFWFAGSREGASDVEIRSAVFDPAQGAWGAESVVTDRSQTQQSLLRYIKKLGNPVAHRAADGTVWLFYVTVSVGGWAGSSIAAMTSLDDGASWGSARRLITSPFLNISTLVKGAPFNYADGAIGIPIYHEFIGKFSELLRISPGGSVLDKQRLTSGRQAIQPVLLVRDASKATVLMRHIGSNLKRVMMAMSTTDRSRHWDAAHRTTLPNPDAAVAGVVMPDGRLLAVVNANALNREELSLAVSADKGATWDVIYRLEDQRGQSSGPQRYAKRAAQLARQTGGMADAAAYGASSRQAKCFGETCDFEFSYPYLIRAKDGTYHLLYTWNRSYIKHVHFVQAWLEQQMKGARRASPH